jgi:hypothetical protein
MAGNQDTRARRGGYSPAMPPAVAGSADSAQAQAEALSGVLPRLAQSAGQAVVNTLPFVNPTSRAAQRDLGNRLVANVAGLAGATGLSADSFRAADAARADMVAAIEGGQSPAGSRGPAATRSTRGQGTTPTPTAQTTGQPLTQVALPPLTQRQVNANAAAQLGQYNVAELAALQGLLPPPAQAPSVEERVMQTLFDRAVGNYNLSQAPGSSVEAAAAGETAFIQQLMQILDPNPLLMPTE